MAYLKIHQEHISPEEGARLVELCPFSAITYEGGALDITAGCKMCGICVRKGPPGAITLEEDPAPNHQVNKADWRGIAVFVDHQEGAIHKVTLELIGKALELAKVTGHQVYALMMGHHIEAQAKSLLPYGVDVVYTYDHPALAQFTMEPYANAFEDFLRQVKPSSVLVGATNLGRSLAPRVAARFGTGLTADCTILEMKENTDLLQIRPAFGGNIMAQIITPNHRPQFCTVRYKIFSAPQPVAEPTGRVQPMELAPELLRSGVEVLALEQKPKEIDLSDAQVVVAVGRGLKNKADLELARQLAEALGAQLACTRPLVESKWMDPRRQIGLSGRTVGAKLLIALGISGAVQFAAGMGGCDCIVAVNSDPAAPIFDIAHYGLVGDLYEILPRLIALCNKEEVPAYV